MPFQYKFNWVHASSATMPPLQFVPCLSTFFFGCLHFAATWCVVGWAVGLYKRTLKDVFGSDEKLVSNVGVFPFFRPIIVRIQSDSHPDSFLLTGRIRANVLLWRIGAIRQFSLIPAPPRTYSVSSDQMPASISH